MTSTSLHPTPPSQTIATEEFRAVGLAIRNEAIFFVAALVVFGVIAIAGTVRFAHTPPAPGSHMGFRYDAAGAIPMFLVGMLIPFGVWRSEDPSRRAYHWSMPVARGPHTVMKLISGWAWLMIATVVYIAFIIAIATAVSAITGRPTWDVTTPGWAWAVTFTAPTLGYLLTSIPVIGSDHPWRWIGGIIIGYAILIAVLKSFGLDDVAAAVNTLSNGRLGLNAALFGVGGNLHRGMGIDEVQAIQRSTWMVAMPLWIICSAIAATIASYRHHE